MNSPEFITSQRVDLSNCEQEAINIPNRIQPHGVLIALQELQLIILHIIKNPNKFKVFFAKYLMKTIKFTIL